MKTCNTLPMLIGLFLFSISSSLFAANTTPSVAYKNQRGSTMTLTWHEGKNNTGTLTGTFTTAVGNCQKDIGKPMPLQGYFNGNAIAIVINFPECKQVVSMSGNVSADQKNISTLWLDANQAQNPVHQNWNSNIIGSDYFQKVS